jgi:hypothetical protein
VASQPGAVTPNNPWATQDINAVCFLQQRELGACWSRQGPIGEASQTSLESDLSGVGNVTAPQRDGLSQLGVSEKPEQTGYR